MIGIKTIRPVKGFTLIEVAVALAILGWVLGSAISLVKQYADERIKMRERFLSNQVAWNQLLEQYQYSHGWQPANESGELEMTGREWQGGRDWYWQMDLEPALGQDLYRYRINVAGEAETEDNSGSSLAIYLLNTP